MKHVHLRCICAQCGKDFEEDEELAKIERKKQFPWLRMGWRCVWDFRCGMIEKTPYGAVQFQDGVQSWLNPEYV